MVAGAAAAVDGAGGGAVNAFSRQVPQPACHLAPGVTAAAAAAGTAAAQRGKTPLLQQ
jgi:hypothetical protein